MSKIDYKGLEQAARFLQNYMRKYGRMHATAKEKFGGVRCYADIGYTSLHTLIYPAYSYNRFPAWLWSLDMDYIGPFLNKVFGRLITWWHEYIYYKAYKATVYKWPHLRHAILVGASYHDLLADGKLVFKLGDKTEILGWDGFPDTIYIANDYDIKEC